MTQSLLELAKDLTLALVKAGRLSAEDMQDTLHTTHATLAALQTQEASGTAADIAVAETAPVNWRKSITKHDVTCLECGESFKQLSVRHLRLHDLDGRSYRVKYGIPRSQSLASRDTTARRRQVVQETRPWEKALASRGTQARNGLASPEIEEPAAAASAAPKKQRKKAPQKKTARKTTAQA